MPPHQRLRPHRAVLLACLALLLAGSLPACKKKSRRQAKLDTKLEKALDETEEEKKSGKPKPTRKAKKGAARVRPLARLGEEDPLTPAEADDAGEAGLQAAAADDVIYAPGGEERSEGVQRSLQRIELAASGWRSEQMHNLAKHEIEEFIANISEPGLRPRADWYLTRDFLGATRLVPEHMETLWDDGSLLVRSSTEIPTELLPRERLRELIDELLAPLEVNRRKGWEIRGKAKIFTTDLDPAYPRRFATNVAIRFLGTTHDELTCQIRTEWRVQWETESKPGVPAIVRMRSIEIVSYEEARSRSPLFADVTWRVFRGLPRYAEEFLLGSGEYHFRTDALDGNVFAGQNGIAVGDVNGDGRDDVFVPQHGGIPNRLLVHQSDGSTLDVSTKAGLDLLDDSASALILDLDNDGDQDIALARGNSILIYENDGRGYFTTRPPGLTAGSDKITSLTSVDWDRDGDLDIYASVYDKRGPLGSVPVPYHDAVNGPPNVAWRNDGLHEWTDVTEELGLTDNDAKFSFAAVWEDFDRDGDPDLYVVNDFGRNNYYRNDDGHFSDVAVAVGADDLGAGMGVTAEDVDLDGWTDLYVTNLWSSAGRRVASQTQQFHVEAAPELRDGFLRHARGNTLLLNNGDGTFRDASEASGAQNGGWAWGAIAIDLNNDGYQDLYSPNGFLTGPKEDDL